MNWGAKNYQERNSIRTNLGEQLFEEHCKKYDYQVHRLGFDEENGSVENFFHLNDLLRNLPDYVVNTGSETFVINVKGTANFKRKEVMLLPEMMEWFSSKKAPLLYAFCFEGFKPKLLYPDIIIKLYEKAQDKTWADGVVYRTLELGKFPPVNV